MHQVAHTQQGAQNALFSRLQFLIKDFCKIVWFLGYNVITLQPDTVNCEETTETNAANCIHAHGNNGNEMRANLLFDLLDKLLTNVKKRTRQTAETTETNAAA